MDISQSQRGGPNRASPPASVPVPVVDLSPPSPAPGTPEIPPPPPPPDAVAQQADVIVSYPPTRIARPRTPPYARTPPALERPSPNTDIPSAFEGNTDNDRAMPNFDIPSAFGGSTANVRVTPNSDDPSAFADSPGSDGIRSRDRNPHDQEVRDHSRSRSLSPEVLVGVTPPDTRNQRGTTSGASASSRANNVSFTVRGSNTDNSNETSTSSSSTSSSSFPRRGSVSGSGVLSNSHGNNVQSSSNGNSSGTSFDNPISVGSPNTSRHTVSGTRSAFSRGPPWNMRPGLDSGNSTSDIPSAFTQGPRADAHVCSSPRSGEEAKSTVSGPIEVHDSDTDMSDTEILVISGPDHQTSSSSSNSNSSSRKRKREEEAGNSSNGQKEEDESEIASSTSSRSSTNSRKRKRAQDPVAEEIEHSERAQIARLLRDSCLANGADNESSSTSSSTSSREEQKDAEASPNANEPQNGISAPPRPESVSQGDNAAGADSVIMMDISAVESSENSDSGSSQTESGLRGSSNVAVLVSDTDEHELEQRRRVTGGKKRRREENESENDEKKDGCESAQKRNENGESAKKKKKNGKSEVTDSDVEDEDGRDAARVADDVIVVAQHRGMVLSRHLVPL